MWGKIRLYKKYARSLCVFFVKKVLPTAYTNTYSLVSEGVAPFIIILFISRGEISYGSN